METSTTGAKGFLCRKAYLFVSDVIQREEEF